MWKSHRSSGIVGRIGWGQLGDKGGTGRAPQVQNLWRGWIGSEIQQWRWEIIPQERTGPWKENTGTFYPERRRKIWRAWGGRWRCGEWNGFAIKMYLTLRLQKLPSEKMSKRPAQSEKRAWLLWINVFKNEWVKPCKAGRGEGGKLRSVLSKFIYEWIKRENPSRTLADRAVLILIIPKGQTLSVSVIYPYPKVRIQIFSPQGRDEFLSSFKKSWKMEILIGVRLKENHETSLNF